MVSRVLLTILIILLEVFFGGTRFISLAPVLWVAAFSLIFSILISPVNNLKTLVKFPFFWIGIIFVIYLFIQNYNVWLVFDSAGVYNYPIYKDFIICLPAGVSSGLREPFSQFEILAQALMLFFVVCAFRLNLKTSDDCLYYTKVVFYTSVISGAMAMAYLLLSPDSFRLWGIIDTYDSLQYGAFLYKNQMGASLMLGGGAGLALFSRNILSKKQDANRVLDILIYAVGLIVITISILYSKSLGAFLFWILAAGFSFVAMLILACKRNIITKKITFAVVISSIAISTFVLILSIKFLPIASFERISKALNSDSPVVATQSLMGGRSVYKSIAIDMINAGGNLSNKSSRKEEFSRILLGNGANSFGHISRLYDRTKYFKVMRLPNETFHIESVAPLILDAHCDILQYTFEYGLLWLFIGVIGIILYLAKLIKSGALVGRFGLIMVINLSIFFVYSCNDIILYNPFLATLYLILLTILLRYHCHPKTN